MMAVVTHRVKAALLSVAAVSDNPAAA